jgi:hypothetical protein
MGRNEEIVLVALRQSLTPHRIYVARIFIFGLGLAELQHKLKPLQKNGHVCSRCGSGNARRNCLKRLMNVRQGLTTAWQQQ